MEFIAMLGGSFGMLWGTIRQDLALLDRSTWSRFSWRWPLFIRSLFPAFSIFTCTIDSLTVSLSNYLTALYAWNTENSSLYSISLTCTLSMISLMFSRTVHAALQTLSLTSTTLSVEGLSLPESAVRLWWELTVCGKIPPSISIGRNLLPAFCYTVSVLINPRYHY